MNTSVRSQQFAEVDLRLKEKGMKTMSDRATTTPDPAATQAAAWTRNKTGLLQFGLGSAALATLVFTPGPAAAAGNNPIVIDFNQGRLILGWAGLWIVTVFALLACNAGGRAMTRHFGHSLAERVRHKLRDWHDASIVRRTRQARDAAAQVLAPQVTTGRIAATHIAVVVAEARSRQHDRVAQAVYPAADRQTIGRRFSNTPMPGLPTHHHTAPV